MIPFLNLSPDIHDSVALPPRTSFLDEIAAVHNNNLDMGGDLSHDGRLSLEEFEPCPICMDLNVFFSHTCKWNFRCDADCHKDYIPDLTYTGCIDPDDMFSAPQKKVQPYTPDYDHCYYALSKEVPTKLPSESKEKPDVLPNMLAPPTSMSEPSSEDEVDVVTVNDDHQPPTVPIVQAPRRNTRSQNMPRQQSRIQTAISPKSVKAAIKRTRVQNDSSYKRRKLNSVETTPSSSGQSSRCNSDTDDSNTDDPGKGEVHNKSERKRREAQRTALQDLRVRIPALRNNPKAPKVLILNSATNLTKQLRVDENKLNELKSRERQKNIELKAKIQSLLSHFSSTF